MVNRCASATLFGFDFQVNAAIVLMLENIKELKCLRLESYNEDIDITLNDDKHILAQAKSVVNASYDVKNVRKNLTKALNSLSEGSKKVEVKSIIYITNSLNPLNDSVSQGIFSTRAFRTYDSLPPSSKEIISKCLGDNELDLSKFSINVLPFETDDERERYKFIKNDISDFVGNLDLTDNGLARKLHQVWLQDILVNGTKKDTSIVLSKKDIIWPIMVIVTDVKRCDDDFLDRFDIGEYEEIVMKYNDIINDKCERVEFYTKILSDYNSFHSDKYGNNKLLDFIDTHWELYANSLASHDLSIKKALTQIVLYNVLKRRFSIERIKKGVGL